LFDGSSAVTLTVTSPVTPQTARRYAAFPRKPRLVRLLAPFASSGAAGGNAPGKRHGRPNVADLCARQADSCMRDTSPDFDPDYELHSNSPPSIGRFSRFRAIFDAFRTVESNIHSGAGPRSTAHSTSPHSLSLPCCTPGLSGAPYLPKDWPVIRSDPGV
jgi:hypothetical protein